MPGEVSNPQRQSIGSIGHDPIPGDGKSESISIGTIRDPDDQTLGYSETAITAEGANNTLVVLLRELLGSRSDHLDRWSDEFRSEIPL